jgi:hypothetical protein
VFNLSDRELDGLESRAKPAESEGYRPIPMSYGSSPFGDDDGSGSPVPAAVPAAPPLPAPVPLPPAPDGSVASGAGKALIFVTLGLVVGAVAGGAWGAATGVVGVGAIRNLGRTKALWNSQNPGDRSEAGKSATMGIFGLGIAGMLGYQAYKMKGKEAFPW